MKLPKAWKLFKHLVKNYIEQAQGKPITPYPGYKKEDPNVH